MLTHVPGNTLGILYTYFTESSVTPCEADARYLHATDEESNAERWRDLP